MDTRKHITVVFQLPAGLAGLSIASPHWQLCRPGYSTLPLMNLACTEEGLGPESSTVFLKEDLGLSARLFSIVIFSFYKIFSVSAE